MRLVLVKAKQIFAQPRAPANHLEKLCFRAHPLKKEQIHYLRHIHACIQHIHRDGNVWCAMLHAKLFYQILGVIDAVIYLAGKLACQIGVVGIKPLHNPFGMGTVGRKNDGFAQPIAASSVTTKIKTQWG